MIREPISQELAKFEILSTDEYASWIWEGLFGYLFEGLGRAAFPGAEPFIEQPEGGLASDLGHLFLKLDRHALERVRAAVVRLLQEADFTDVKQAVVALHLLRLGANIKALGLPAILAQKRVTIPANDAGEQLFATAFDIATQAGFREPLETVDCLRLLVGSPLFPPNWTGRALVGMTRADPEGFPGHFIALRERLHQAYHIERSKWFVSTETGAERVAVVRQIARLLGDDKVGMLVQPLHDGDTDSWWLQTLEDPRLAGVRESIDRVLQDPEPPGDIPTEASPVGNFVADYDTVEEFFQRALA